MKHRVLACFLGIAVWGTVTTAAGEVACPRALLTSPDHPRTFWTSQFDEIDRYLQWNPVERVLEGTVDYGLPSRPAPSDPVDYDSIKVRFPAVHLDSRDQRLYFLTAHKHQITVGRIESGAFGNRVVLKTHISFDAHRHRGHLDAALVSD
jgi:hypothetical protein